MSHAMLFRGQYCVEGLREILPPKIVLWRSTRSQGSHAIVTDSNGMVD